LGSQRILPVVVVPVALVFAVVVEILGHLEEEQEGELLDVVVVGEAVIPEDGAVFPELLDDGGWAARK